MIKYILFLIMILGLTGHGQNIFLLEKAGGAGMHMFRTNDFIKLMPRNSNIKIEGRISLITDSSIFVNSEVEVPLRNIESIYRKRRMFTLLQAVSLAAGLLYISISTLNGVINNDSPLVSDETLKISGGLIAAGVLLTPLTTRKHPISQNRWKVKILDLTD